MSVNVLRIGVLCVLLVGGWSPFNLSGLRVPSPPLSLSRSYMSIVESLPTYGVHYYAVKVQFYCPGSFLVHTPMRTQDV